MFVVRNLLTHEIVARGFKDRKSAERKALELINKEWKHYEAYPEDVA